MLGADKGYEKISKVKNTLDRFFREYNGGASGSSAPIGMGNDCVILEGSMDDDENWDEFD